MDNARIQPGCLSGILNTKAQDNVSTASKQNNKGFDTLLNQAMDDKHTTPAKAAKEKRVARAKAREHVLESKRAERVARAHDTKYDNTTGPVDRQAYIHQIKDDLRHACDKAGIDPQEVESIDFDSLDDNTLESVAKIVKHIEEPHDDSAVVDNDEMEESEHANVDKVLQLLTALDASSIKDLLTKIISAAGESAGDDDMGVECAEALSSSGKLSHINSDKSGKEIEGQKNIPSGKVETETEHADSEIMPAALTESVSGAEDAESTKQAPVQSAKTDETAKSASAKSTDKTAVVPEYNDKNKIEISAKDVKIVAVESVPEETKTETADVKTATTSVSEKKDNSNTVAPTGTISIENENGNDKSAEVKAVMQNEISKNESGKIAVSEQNTYAAKTDDNKISASVATEKSVDVKVVSTEKHADINVKVENTKDKSSEIKVSVQTSEPKVDPKTNLVEDKTAVASQSSDKKISTPVAGGQDSKAMDENVKLSASQNNEVAPVQNKIGVDVPNAAPKKEFVAAAEKVIENLKALGVPEETLMQAAQATDLEDLKQKIGRWLESKNTARLSEYLKALPQDKKIELAIPAALSAQNAELAPAMKTPGTLWEVFRRRAENPEEVARETINFAHAVSNKATDKSGIISPFALGNTTAVGASRVGFDTVPGADQTAMIDRISNITAMSAAKKINSISIELTPPDLGKLQINLALKGGLLHATMKTESQAAHNILQANIDVLKDNLAQQGVQVAKMELSFQDDRQRQGWQENRFAYQEHQENQRGSYHRERNYSEERTAVEIESAKPVLVGANSLNVVI